MATKRPAKKTPTRAEQSGHIIKTYTFAEIKGKASDLDQLLTADLPDSKGVMEHMMRTRGRLKTAEGEFEDRRQIILMRHAEHRDKKLVPDANGQPKWNSKGDEDQAKASIARLLDTEHPVKVFQCEWKDLLDEDGNAPEGRGVKLLLFRCSDFITGAPWQDGGDDDEEPAAADEASA